MRTINLQLWRMRTDSFAIMVNALTKFTIMVDAPKIILAYYLNLLIVNYHKMDFTTI